MRTSPRTVPVAITLHDVASSRATSGVPRARGAESGFPEPCYRIGYPYGLCRTECLSPNLTTVRVSLVNEPTNIRLPP